jgi:predicted permease
MQQISLISTCLVIGIVLRLTGRLPDNATKVLGGFVIDVALPAAASRSVHIGVPLSMLTAWARWSSSRCCERWVMRTRSRHPAATEDCK